MKACEMQIEYLGGQKRTLPQQKLRQTKLFENIMQKSREIENQTEIETT